MRIALDFDGTIVNDEHAYDDLETPLEFLPGEFEAISALKAAGHILILWSGRSNTALRWDWQHNPLWAMNPAFDVEKWEANKIVNQKRFQQMLDFVEENLPDVFTYVDFGNQGKVSADLYIDDRTGNGRPDWDWIRTAYGEPLPATAAE